jgi:hypothetical protein
MQSLLHGSHHSPLTINNQAQKWSTMVLQTTNPNKMPSGNITPGEGRRNSWPIYQYFKCTIYDQSTLYPLMVVSTKLLLPLATNMDDITFGEIIGLVPIVTKKCSTPATSLCYFPSRFFASSNNKSPLKWNKMHVRVVKNGPY